MINIPIDKQLHVGVGLLIGLVLGCRPITAIIVVVLAGIGKELYDYISNLYLGGSHSVEVLDAVATIVGGVTGVVIVQVLGYFIGGL